MFVTSLLHTEQVKLLCKLNVLMTTWFYSCRFNNWLVYKLLKSLMINFYL